MGRPLNPEKAARVAALIVEGETRARIMEAVGCTRASVELVVSRTPSLQSPEALERFGEIDLGRVASLLDHPGMTYADAARLLGCSAAKVFNLMQALPAECRPQVERRRGPSIDLDAVLALREDGKSWPEIAGALGCSADGARQAVAQHRRETRVHRVPPPWKFVPSDPAGGVPLTPEWKCTHKPIPSGSLSYCLGCDQCGHTFKAVRALPPSAPAGKADPRRRWSAEARDDAGKLAVASAGLTRKERRALKFAKGEADRARELVAKLAGTARLDQVEREGDALSRTYMDVGGGVSPGKARGGGLTFGRAVASPAGAH